MRHHKLKKALALSFVFLMLAVMYIPILLLIAFSFTGGGTIGDWEGFTFELYIDMFRNADLLDALGNTLLIGVIAAGGAMIIGTLTAVGLHSMRSKRARAIINGATRITVINADIVTAAAFMLLFLTVRFIPLGFATIIIAHTVITIPYVILTVTPRLTQLNPNLYEAGLDLGAGPMRSLRKVILPQLIPAMIGGFALAFALSLDDFVITSFNNGGMRPTLSTYLYDARSKGGIPEELRAVSALIFVVSFAILIAVNVRASKRAKQAAKNKV
jgi:spermidine/putrescine transport system permease protein